MGPLRLSVREILSGKAPKEAPVTVKGWVRTRRDSKAGFSFVHLSDGSSFHPLQVVAPKDLPNYEGEVLHLTSGCAIEATGTIVPSPARGQPFEMQAAAVKVVGWVEDPDHYPIQPKPHSLEFLREVAHLRPRTNVIGAATRVRHTLAQAIHRFFHEQGFFWVNTPIITAADAEGAGALFRVSTLDLANLPRVEDGRIDFSKDFFGREAFLTVSGQLNVEAYCLAMSKVYTFGPTFRAEKSKTRRHLTEFWMVEPEMAYADIHDSMALGEAMIEHVVQSVLGRCSAELKTLERDLTQLEKIRGPFPGVSGDRPEARVRCSGRGVREEREPDLPGRRFRKKRGRRRETGEGAWHLRSGAVYAKGVIQLMNQPPFTLMVCPVM